MRKLRGELAENFYSIRRAINKRYRERHKASGLCLDCSRPAVGSRCDKCGVKRKSQMRETYQWKKSNGYCVRTGCWEKRGIGVCCGKHREQFRLLENERRSKYRKQLELGCPAWPKNQNRNSRGIQSTPEFV